MTIAELAAKYEQYVIDMRREFHENPELSHHEERTVRRIREELDKLGIPNITVGHNNVIGTLEGGKPGKKIAIRADIDALPVAEANEVPYKSKVEGVMHACGHDGHAAMLLGTAHVLSEIRDQLCGTVYLCFQVAEEIGAGADEIVAYLGSIGGVDQAIGTHLAGGDPAGVINLPDGPMMAGALGFEITVKGVGGHGSRPDRAVDPVKPACDIVLKIAMIPAQYHNPFDTCVVSPCQITAGNKNNIIPETAEMRGTIRYFKEEALDRTLELVEQISRDIAASYDATATLTYSRGKTIPVDNDAASIAAAREVVENIDGLTAIQAPKLMGSDNFADFVHAFPGFYCFMGAGFDGPDGSLPNHHPRFTLDEKAFRLGVEFLTGCAVKFLGE